MKNILFLWLLTLGLRVSAQSTAPPPPPPPPQTQSPCPPKLKCDTCDEVLVFAHEMPQFPGGQTAFEQYLKENINYPDTAKKYGREGTVYIYFEVSKDGKVGNARCVKGVPKAPELCEEALRVVRIMPNWEPGKMDGKAVKVSMTVPIKFSLH